MKIGEPRVLGYCSCQVEPLIPLVHAVSQFSGLDSPGLPGCRTRQVPVEHMYCPVYSMVYPRSGIMSRAQFISSLRCVDHGGRRRDGCEQGTVYCCHTTIDGG